ncbi:hypothetical protein FACS1894177_06530 [Bacteroidia bacterium]|nr:hypothetical protein FACS1894177_06530 [Bacteroidia bacterium]
MNPEVKRRFGEWQKHCEDVGRHTTVNESESKQDQAARIQRARKDYAFFVEYYFPHWCTDSSGKIIPSARFHIEAANRIKENKTLKAAFKWARGHAKSTHIGVFTPMWMMCQEKREINVMVLVGKSQDSANTLLSDVQAELQYNQRFIHDFGEQYNAGHWVFGEFVTKSGVAFFARGRGQSPRGLRYRDKRPDYIVIDDLDDDELCLNKDRVDKLTKWVKEALFGSFGAAGGRFIMVGNLISKQSVLANIAASEGMFVTRVDVRDEHGNPSWPELWTEERIREKEMFMGFISFQKEYMNNPIAEGTVFKEIVFGKVPPLNRFRFLIGYGDPAPANSENGKGSFKSLFLVGFHEGVYYIIKGFLDHTTNANFVNWYYALRDYTNDKTQLYYFVENNTLQNPFYEQVFVPLFLEASKTQGFIGITPDERKKPDKFSRIEGNLEPLNRFGKLIFNEEEKENPNMHRLSEQFKAVNPGTKPPDGPDCIEGAVWIINQKIASMIPDAFTFGQKRSNSKKF